MATFDAPPLELNHEESPTVMVLRYEEAIPRANAYGHVLRRDPHDEFHTTPGLRHLTVRYDNRDHLRTLSTRALEAVVWELRGRKGKRAREILDEKEAQPAAETEGEPCIIQVLTPTSSRRVLVGVNKVNLNFTDLATVDRPGHALAVKTAAALPPSLRTVVAEKLRPAADVLMPHGAGFAV